MGITCRANLYKLPRTIKRGKRIISTKRKGVETMKYTETMELTQDSFQILKHNMCS